jgi:hypothetical protein
MMCSRPTQPRRQTVSGLLSSSKKKSPQNT